MISRDQKDLIYNALIIGMDLADAYVYAGLTPTQIAAVAEDADLQAEWARYKKQHEFSLLTKLSEVMEKQKHMGKEGAVTWALEHMYPRYGNKPTADGQPLTINLNVDKHGADVEVDE